MIRSPLNGGFKTRMKVKKSRII